MYKIVIRLVSKFLSKHKWDKLLFLFKKRLTILRDDPYKNNLDIKSLSVEKNRYRLRIWKYRFLYEVFDEIILISFFKADTRGWIYKK